MKPLQPYFCTKNKGDQPKILLKEPPFVAVPIIILLLLGLGAVMLRRLSFT